MKNFIFKSVISVIILLIVVLAIYIGVTQPPSVDTAPFVERAKAYDTRIIRDDRGVPHIFGPRDVDVTYGLAYANAEDDYSTIQDVVLATRGKLATLKGMDAAKTDYVIAFMGVWDAVNTQYDTELDPQARAIAEAYADGMNHYAALHPDEVSDYVLPYTGKDIIAGFTFKMPLFYGFDRMLGDVVSGDAKSIELALGKSQEHAFLVTDTPQAELGSQGIAVAPSRTDDGHTRLLINSHQPLAGPVAWYEARLKSDEGLDIVGGTFPGSPLILHGANANLGWASTVNAPDLADVYKLEMNPDNDREYRLDGEWVMLEVQDVPLTIKLWGPLYMTVNEPLYRSAHGPVMKTDHGHYAFRWSGQNQARQLEFYLGANKAKNQEDFEAALKLQVVSSINFVYGDNAGNIAHYYNAVIPDRRADMSLDWTKVLPGDRSDLIWDDYLDYELVPRTVNPASGIVFNANNAPYVSTVGEGQPIQGPEFVSDAIETKWTNRARRILKLGAADTAISHEDLRRIKYDLKYAEDSAFALAIKDFIDSGLNSTDAEDNSLSHAFSTLKSWDLGTNRDNRATALALLTLHPKAVGLEATASILESFKMTVAKLIEHHDRVDPFWGDVSKLVRGDEKLPIDGGPDILRAVYFKPMNDEGILEATAGDTLILFADWDKEGVFTGNIIHNYGSASTRPNSKHYGDQAPIFTAMKEVPVLWKKEDLLAHKTADYSPGEIH